MASPNSPFGGQLGDLNKSSGERFPEQKITKVTHFLMRKKKTPRCIFRDPIDEKHWLLGLLPSKLSIAKDLCGRPCWQHRKEVDVRYPISLLLKRGGFQLKQY